MTAYTYCISFSHITLMVCMCMCVCVTHVYSSYELVHGIYLIDRIYLIDLIDLLTNLRTQFSGTICPILMKLIHVIEEGMYSLYTNFEANLMS